MRQATTAAAAHTPASFDIPDYAEIEAARTRIAGIALRTPVLTSRAADASTGGSLFFKCENLQRSGSFKFRGAYNAMACLTAEEKTRGVIAFSSGNHGQCLALSGQLQGVSVTIVMPSDAPDVKLAATRDYGAEVITYDRHTEDRDGLVASLTRERGLTGVPPYDHRQVIAGQGTVAAELIEETGPLDILLVCLGGGGLVSGCALAAAKLSPGCTVIGIEPEAGNDGQQSFRSDTIVRIAAPKSIADGALTTSLGERTFAIIRTHVSDVLTVSDADLVTSMRFFAEQLKMVVEPTGCLAATAALTGAVDCAGKRVGVIVSGGNVDLAKFAQFLVPPRLQ